MYRLAAGNVLRAADLTMLLYRAFPDVLNYLDRQVSLANPFHVSIEADDSSLFCA